MLNPLQSESNPGSVKRQIAKLCGPAAAFVIFLVLWELVSRLGLHSGLLPGPISVSRALFEMMIEGQIFRDSLISLQRVFMGFGIAVVLGLTLGFMYGSSAIVRHVFGPIIEFIRPIPPIAWIPLSVVLLGLGDPSSYFIIFLGAFFPIFTNTALGVRELNPLFLDAARVLGASRMRITTEVIWPSALPSIFAGLRVSLGFAWMCVVAAEMIAARSGLGYQLQLDRQLLRLDRVVAGMVAIGVVGLVMVRLMEWVEAICLPWKRLYSDSVDATTPDILALEYHPVVTPTTEQLPGAQLSARGISFHYSNVSVIQQLDLEVAPGEILAILGPSGCGKTTLLRLLVGLQTPSSGQILIDDQLVAAHQQDITMIFQGFALFPWFTAQDNIEFALESRNVNLTSRKSIANDFLRLVGLDSKSSFYPHELSGGQQQRVAVARALAYRPRLLLMDEPFGSLDGETRQILQEDISELLHTTNNTVILVTHDVAEAVFMADRIVVMSRDGTLLADPLQVPIPRPRVPSFRTSAEYLDLTSRLSPLLRLNSSAP
ncbi:MAG: ATP-binding cassette domain-containing protein [Planctomycetota bacterium]